MSRFHSALDLVLDALDRRREAGYNDWRASTGVVTRLRSATFTGTLSPAATPAQKSAPAPAVVPEPAPVVQAKTNPIQEPPETLAPAFPAVLPDTSPVPPFSTMPAASNPPSDDSLSLFGEDEVPAAPAISDGGSSKTGKKGKTLAPSAPGIYEPVTDPVLPKAERLAQLRACPERIPCAECPYGAGPHNHVVFGVGDQDTEIMFVGEAPGADEDKQGEPFVGRAGQLLNKIVATMGFERSKIYLANVLKCRPDTPGQSFGNRPPTQTEMRSCRPTLFEQIDIIGPKVIVALGATAVKGLLELEAPMRDLRGRFHDYKGIPIMVTYHPSYLLRNQSVEEKRKVWEDMLLVKEKLGQTITEKDRSYFLTKG